MASITIKDAMQKLLSFHTLSYDESLTILTDIAAEKYNTSQIASFLTVYMMRPISVDELSGFRDGLRNLCLKVDLSDFHTVDMCGTGGDGKHTFNISTLASFVVAGAGGKVSKHGNYGVSSGCGSSNVVEYLGYKFTNDASTLKKQLDKAGICFLHAPLFHPAMKAVAPIRRELGLKTFFNMLGPLVNPTFPNSQVAGVYSLELARLYNYLLQKEEISYVVVHSLDGYDEVSLTGDFKFFTRNGESLSSPESLGLKKLTPADISGGEDIPSAAKVFMQILEGKGTEAQNNVVCVNAALGLVAQTPSKTMEQAIFEANESLKSGRALNSLKTLLSI